MNLASIYVMFFINPASVWDYNYDSIRFACYRTAWESSTLAWRRVFNV